MKVFCFDTEQSNHTTIVFPRPNCHHFCLPPKSIKFRFDFPPFPFLPHAQAADAATSDAMIMIDMMIAVFAGYR
jgi:hypothetical protein